MHRPTTRAPRRAPGALAALLEASALAVAPGSAAALVRALAAARRAGVARQELAELGLMLRLYAGFPAAIEFLRALERAAPGASSGASSGAAPGRAGRTIGRAGASHTGAPPGARGLVRRGEALCRRVYGPDYLRLRAFMRRLHPDLDRWMIEDGYGKTLARKGLSVKRRELATVAALAALGWTVQGRAHAAGARRAGATAAEVALAGRIGTRCRARAHS